MRKKLLLADDSITIQKVVELTFPSDEFEVVTAGNGRLAVEKAMTFLPDMVLCDVIMPQLDGYQVCEALRASPDLTDVPILLLNGAFEPYDAERARAAGALGNVSKPFDPPALVARVKQILAARPSPPVAAPPDPAIQAYTGETHTRNYDYLEGQPVSTVDVPTDVRDLAARSLSLDAPVFTDLEPEVLAAQAAPPDFSETLHDPLEGGTPPQDGPVSELVEEMAAIEEFTPIAGTGEIKATGTRETEIEIPSPSYAAAERELPSTLPPPAPLPPGAAIPLPAVASASAIFELSPQEHEFEPDLEAHAAEGSASRAAERPEANEPVAATEPMDLGKIAAVAQLAGFAATASSAPAAVPSAEVAVPVDMVQQIAQRVISQVSERVIHQIAWDVIPGLAEKLIKAEIERIKARAESEHD